MSRSTIIYNWKFVDFIDCHLIEIVKRKLGEFPKSAHDTVIENFHLHN